MRKMRKLKLETMRINNFFEQFYYKEKDKNAVVAGEESRIKGGCPLFLF